MIDRERMTEEGSKLDMKRERENTTITKTTP
jgi:hypothetical protein